MNVEAQNQILTDSLEGVAYDFRYRLLNTGSLVDPAGEIVRNNVADWDVGGGGSDDAPVFIQLNTDIDFEWGSGSSDLIVDEVQVEIDLGDGAGWRLLAMLDPDHPLDGSPAAGDEDVTWRVNTTFRVSSGANFEWDTSRRVNVVNTSTETIDVFGKATFLSAGEEITRTATGQTLTVSSVSYDAGNDRTDVTVSEDLTDSDPSGYIEQDTAPEVNEGILKLLANGLPGAFDAGSGVDLQIVGLDDTGGFMDSHTFVYGSEATIVFTGGQAIVQLPAGPNEVDFGPSTGTLETLICNLREAGAPGPWFTVFEDDSLNQTLSGDKWNVDGFSFTV
jgi:hypothetical protein